MFARTATKTSLVMLSCVMIAASACSTSGLPVEGLGTSTAQLESGATFAVYRPGLDFDVDGLYGVRKTKNPFTIPPQLPFLLSVRDAVTVSVGDTDTPQGGRLVWRVSLPDQFRAGSGIPSDSVPLVAYSQYPEKRPDQFTLAVLESRDQIPGEYVFDTEAPTATKFSMTSSLMFFSPSKFAESVRSNAARANPDGAPRPRPECPFGEYVATRATATAAKQVTDRGQIYPCVENEGSTYLALSLFSGSNISWRVEPRGDKYDIGGFERTYDLSRPVSGYEDSSKIHGASLLPSDSYVRIVYQGAAPEEITLKPSFSSTLVSALLVEMGKEVYRLTKTTVAKKEDVWSEMDGTRGSRCLTQDIDLARTASISERKAWLKKQVECVASAVDEGQKQGPYSDVTFTFASAMYAASDSIAEGLMPLVADWSTIAGRTYSVSLERK